MDISQFAGTDYVEVALAGDLYRVGELTLGEWAPLQAWLKANSPSPMAALRSEELAGLSAADRREVLTIALGQAKAWPPRIGSAAWLEALDAPGGAAQLLHALLRKHNPRATLEACEGLAERVQLAELPGLLLVALGYAGDPKSRGPAPTTTTAPPAPTPTT